MVVGAKKEKEKEVKKAAMICWPQRLENFASGINYLLAKLDVPILCGANIFVDSVDEAVAYAKKYRIASANLVFISGSMKVLQKKEMELIRQKCSAAKFFSFKANLINEKRL